MKKIYPVAGLAVLLIALACFVSIAKAVIYDYYPAGKTSGRGDVWQLKTVDQYDPTKTFSGNDVIESSISATYWIDGNTYTLVPKNIVLNDNKVQLVFDPEDLPARADGSSITGSLTNGKTFQVTGPGWSWASTH
jgi:hypothetical protein